ncbi:right-handed parallel beta-helix repeat-containing protein [Crocinitomix catalasitica]|uniref:right-handed parallel beta-helix repeat-containing protein n=1 Tax=Crocinitomix catalasitica TaxID=184607 RepID=UPI000487AFBE|nr:right-handed parallel beta-helix repeat-containing protein [Crocinitomix catalasitica]
MKAILIIFIFSIIVFGCKKNKIVDDLSPGLIENKTFNSTVLIDGHEYDGTIFRNCVFELIEGDGLQIRDVDNLIIENCTFRNISEDAIRFRNSGTSNGVQIINNLIFNIEENGILAPENHINTIIHGNTIHNIATNNTSSQFGAPHHGIYFQGFNVLITENLIYNIINSEGNGISIRTYGEISKNKIFLAKDHGISYFSDHPGNGEQLLIENNIIYDNGKRGINLASNGETGNHIGNVLIRFNTLLTNTESPIGINDELTGVTFDIIANIAIRTDGGETYIYSTLPYNETHNIFDTGDIGFADFSQRNLHIIESSSAVNAGEGLIDFPLNDFDGESRTEVGLDAGADELH